MSRLENQPKYKIGQAVVVELETTHAASGKTFKNKVVGLISQIYASGTDQKDTYQYGITTDMPACYYNGEKPFIHVWEDHVVLHEETTSPK